MLTFLDVALDFANLTILVADGHLSAVLAQYWLSGQQNQSSNPRQHPPEHSVPSQGRRGEGSQPRVTS